MADRLEAGDPERIGEFWLSGRLGAGGQGVVYDAYGPDGIRAAVKVLHGAQASSGELARMAAEARAAQRVASFCTARILQVRLEPPRPYIVSEYIDGLSLQDTVAGAGERVGRRFGGDDLHRLGIGIATALTAIHQAKVVHRDLKPANVLLGPDGPRLIDFGIARVLDTHSVTGGGFTGTLRYTAPEVYGGQPAEAEADVFAWAATMVFAATGEHAFKGGTLPEIAHRIRTHDPDLTALPDTLRPLVAAALAKDPLVRPPARAILAALTGDPQEGAGDLADLVAAGAAQAGPHSRWEPGDPALGKLAEDAYAALPPHEQSLVPEVFLRCVVAGDGGSLATRPIPAAELFDRRDPTEAEALRRVVRAFPPLLAETGDQAGEQIVLARPAVLRAWPRLLGWVEDEREGLRIHQHVRQAARTWSDHGHRSGDVLTGAHLDEAVRWATLTGHGPSLNRLERGLLEASTRAQTARSRRIRVVASVLAVTTLLSLAATGWAFRAQQTTVRQRDIAAARQLAAQSRQFSSAAPDKAALLAVAARRIRDTPESRAALKTIVAGSARGILSGYQADPAALAADRDGRLLAIGNADGTVALWDVRGHRRVGGFLRLFTPSTVASRISVALSPDGLTLAAAATEKTKTKSGVVTAGTVRLWDVRTRRPLGDLPVPSLPSRVVFTADGKKVAVDNGEGVGLWDVRTRRQGSYVPHSTTDARAYTVIGPGATTVATGLDTEEGPSTMQLWDLATGRRKTAFPVRGTARALSPDGRTVVTLESASEAAGGDKAYLWDARTGRQRGRTIRWSSDNSGGVGPFSPDGRVVVIGRQLWDTARALQLGSIDTEAGGSVVIATFVGEHTVASLSLDQSSNLVPRDSHNTVRLWDVTRHQPDRDPFPIGWPEEYILHGASPDGRTLITYNDTSSGPPTFRTWDVTTRRETRPPIPMPAGRSDVDEIVVGPDGRTFAIGNSEGQSQVWDPAAHRWFRLDGGPGDSIGTMAFSPNGRVLATGGAGRPTRPEALVDSKVQLWDLEKHTLITKRPLFSSGTGVTALAFSRDGRTLAAGIGQSTRLWSVSDRRPQAPPIGGSASTIYALAFSRDGRTLAIGTLETTVLWNVRERHQIGAPLAGHTGTEISLAFSRDGTTLATGQDEVVRLWDTSTQSQIGAPLAGHYARVSGLAFSPDATTLTTSDNSATVRRWNIAAPRDPTAIACSIAGRTLTRAEWAQYVPPGIGYRDVCPSLT